MENIVYKSRHFEVVKESNNFYGVYEKYCSSLITSSATKTGAIKKVTLLEKGYSLAIDVYN